MTLKRLVSSFAALTLIYLTVISPVIAQETSSTKTDKTDREEQKKKLLETRTFAMLDSISGGIQNLKLPDNRVRADMSVARALWARDQDRARTLFRQAGTDVAAMITQIDTDDQRWDQQVQSVSQLRMELVQSVAGYDAKLALEILQATEFPVSMSIPWIKNSENEMEAQIAHTLAATDPAAAVAAAEKTLSNGLSYNLVNIVNQVLSKDVGLATKLSDEIADKLSGEDLLSNQTAASIDMNFLNVINLSRNGSKARNYVADDSQQSRSLPSNTISRFVELLVNAALNAKLNSGDQMMNNSATNILNWLAGQTDLVQKYTPSLSGELEKKLARFQQTNSQSSAAEMNQLFQNGTAEAMVSAAASAPAYLQDNYYSNATQKAINQGNLDLAMDIIENDLKNSDTRDQYISQIASNYVNSGKSDKAENLANSKIQNANYKNNIMRQISDRKIADQLEQSKIDEALSLASHLPLADQVGKLVQISQTLIGKDKKEQAGQTLEKAWNLIPAKAADWSQLQSKLTVLSALAPIDGAKTSAYMQTLIVQLNDMIGAAEKLNGFDVNYFKEDELQIQGGNLQSYLQQCGTVLALIAANDFDAAKSLSEQLERPEARVIVQLAMVTQLSQSSGGSIVVIGKRYIN